MTEPKFDLAGKRIFIAGHRGMVGSALVRRLEREDCEVVTAGRSLDLREQGEVRRWMAEHRPDAVVVAAARVGGILANSSHPGPFLYDNLMIAANIIESARRAEVAKLLYLGSSCAYPRMAPQPIPEEALLAGPLEPTNQWYGVAKIAGVKLAEAYAREYRCDFLSAMPCNLYGPGDTYDPLSSHVLPALIMKAHAAKEAAAATLEVWGSGEPLREFLHVDDLADACIFLLRNYSQPELINVGSGEEIAIGDLARLVARAVGFQGKIVFDTSKPDGTPRKLMDSARIRALGWRPSIGLEEGVADAYRWYLDHAAT